MRGPRGIYLVTYVALTVYVVVLVALPGLLPGWTRDALLGNLPFVGAAVLLVRRAASHPEQRLWTLPLALATTVYLLGNLAYMVQSARGDVTFPSAADVGYLLAYPLLLLGLMLALRENLRGARLIVALDGLSGTLAGAAVVTCAIAPLVDRVWDGSVTAATTLAYPVCAVVAVAATFGALGMVGRSKGRGFLVWALGMLLFGLGDVAYAYRLAYDSYEVGTWLDALWPTGLVLVAAGAASLRPTARRTVPGARSLIVVAVAAVSTVVVLAAAPPWHENTLPTVLALLTLVACGVRLVLAFLQLRELAAVRELALTDELTGAANRRALYAALDALFAREADPRPPAAGLRPRADRPRPLQGGQRLVRPRDRRRAAPDGRPTVHRRARPAPDPAPVRAPRR